jgi:MFS family permease
MSSGGASQSGTYALHRIHAAIRRGGLALRFRDMDGQGKLGEILADRGAKGPWRKRPSTILWVLSTGQLITWGLVYYTFPLFVAPMEKELGWSRNDLFGALSAGLMVAGLCSIPVGAWIDRGHGRKLMTGGSLLAAIMMFVWSRTQSLPVFYLVWLGLGACQSVTLYEPAFAVITRVYGPRFRQAIMVMTFVGGLASTFGIPFAQLLIDRIDWRPTLVVLAAINLGVALFIHWLFVPGPHEKAVPIEHSPSTATSRPKRGPLAMAVRVPAFWGLVVAFAGYGLAFSAMSFHLIPLLAERHVEIGVVMAIIALIGPMQVVGRVLLMAGQRHITAIQLGALIYFAFPIAMSMLAAGVSDVYGLILFAIIYGVANGLVTILRGMAVPEFIGPQGYGVVSGALTMPTNVMRAAGPILASLAWSAFGNYTPVLWGLAAIMLVAAAGFAAAALLSKKEPPPRP